LRSAAKLAWIAAVMAGGLSVAAARESRECFSFMANWYKQLEANELPSAATSFVGITRECKEALQGPIGKYAYYFIDRLKGRKLHASRMEVLQALYDARFVFPQGDEPSAWWSELALQALERNDLEGARKVAERIDGPATLIAMRVDRRYDRLTQAMPGRFDVVAAQAAYLEKLRARIADAPRSLDARVNLARGLRKAGRWQEALDDVDAALAGGESAFDDWAEFHPWAHTMRGFVLLDMQKYDEAVAALRRANEVNSGEDKVSFVLNLGYAQVSLNRSEEALETLKSAGEGSDYGDLVRALVELNASVQRQDSRGIEAALKTLREKRGAEPTGYVDALLAAGRIKDARQYLIELLADPELRGHALLAVQDFRGAPPLPGYVAIAEGWKKLVAMPQVRKAILAVGRIESFDFPSPQ
jgi:tetratricopeptide (TPR) repeat protein